MEKKVENQDSPNICRLSLMILKTKQSIRLWAGGFSDGIDYPTKNNILGSFVCILPCILKAILLMKENRAFCTRIRAAFLH